jgi:CDP-glucose 4,6-dehydratase
MAAQPLVRYSYKNPLETFEVNVIGTLKVFEAVRKCSSVKAVVNITSDKCYENREWVWGYRENEPMGGYDPYSASKGCSELLTSSYRNSFFAPEQYKKTHGTLLSSVRAGNVIGGGDWGEDRLVPDIMKAASENKPVQIRNPKAVRPWQHVLEPLSGYLLVGQKLLDGRMEYAGAWNFGPDIQEHRSVEFVVCELRKHWNKIDYLTLPDEKNLHEANILKLDCSKAHSELRWRPVWNSERAFEMTGEWYRAYYENNKVLSRIQLEQYLRDADNKKMVWIT